MAHNNSSVLENFQPEEDGEKIISDHALYFLKAVFDAVLTQALCIFGTVSNAVNIIVFCRMGLSETINISLLALAVSDLGSCFVLTWRNLVYTPWFADLSLPFEPNEISYMSSLWPHNMFVSATKLFTAFICVERCLCVTLPLRVKTIITRKRVIAYCVCSYIFVILPFLPLMYTHRYGGKFSPYRNKTLVGIILTSDAVKINTIIYPILNIFYSTIPFVVIFLATVFLVVSLRKNSRWRQKTLTSSAASATSKNEKRVSKMVVIISILFIACFCPYGVALVLQSVVLEISVSGKYKNTWKMMGSVVFFFECLNSSCNIFIYFTNSTIYRTTFKAIFFSKKKNDATQSK